MNPTHAGLALVVGIDYRDGAAPPLRGAVNDARSVAGLLGRFGFAPDRIRLLLDGAATRAALDAAFTDLARAAGPETPVVFYFAGHGTRMPAPHLGGEPDLFDEALVPADRPTDGGPSRDIRDDTLRGWLDRVRATGAAVTAVLDCCHAGSATRGGRDDAPKSRWAAPYAGPLPPEAPAPRPTGALGPLVALGAAADHQPAAETRDDPPHGLMTRALIDLLDGDGPRPTWAELHDRLRTAVRAQSPDQTPQIEGDGVDREVFGAARRPLVGDYRVSTDPRGWRVEAGFLAGLHPGDELAVVPLGEQAPSGAVRVESTGPCISRVRPVRGRVPDPCRALAPDAPFELRVHAPPATIEASDRIRPVSPGDADVRLDPIPGGWRLSGPHIVTTTADRAALPDRLRRWSGWFGLHRLSGGSVTVDVGLRRRGDDRPRDEAAPLALAPGDIYIVKARHDAPGPMHLALVELVDDGAIAVHRWAGGSEPGWQAVADQPVAPGRTVFFGARARLAEGRTADRCTFVVIATATPAGFEALAQAPVRGEAPDLPPAILRMSRRRGDLPGAVERWGIGRAVCETRRPEVEP